MFLNYLPSPTLSTFSREEARGTAPSIPLSGIIFPGLVGLALAVLTSTPRDQAVKSGITKGL